MDGKEREGNARMKVWEGTFGAELYYLKALSSGNVENCIIQGNLM